MEFDHQFLLLLTQAVILTPQLTVNPEKIKGLLKFIEGLGQCYLQRMQDCSDTLPRQTQGVIMHI